ncbi:MAG: cache domain-containing protein [Candidatus Polarisedimenticolaceae bacterium]|nr:cache domain-containing protein [Candidatus Polarisedimenticolaceae bacterium]
MLADLARIKLVPTKAALPTTRTVETRGMVVHTATPVLGGQGVLVAGTLLNRNLHFIDTINDLVYPAASLTEGSRGTATLFLEDVRVSTNVRLFENVRALGTRVSVAVRSSVLDDGNVWLDRAFVVNDWYISAYEPITDSFGARVGMLYVGFLDTPFRAAKQRTLWMIAAGFLVLIALSVPIFLRLARGIFKPLEEMVATIARVEQGDLGARSRTHGPDDEIARVSGHLDLLLDRVQERDRQQRNWARELNEKVDERTRELREANQRLEATTKQLVVSEKLAAVGEITAGIAHEINNPIAVIQGNLDVIREELGENADAMKVEFGLIYEQVHSINILVNKLLQFARPEEYAGVIDQHVPNDVINDSIPLVQHLLNKVDIGLDLDLRADRPVAMNRTELQQVLTDAPGDTFDLQATLQRLLDTVIKELSKPEINLESFTCTLDLLAHLDLVTKDGDQYGFNLDGWQALLSDADNYLQNQLQIIITDSTRRRALLNTLNGCFDLDLRAFPFGLLGDGPSIDLPGLAPLQELLAALNLLLPSTSRHDFEIPDWVNPVTPPLSKEDLFHQISGIDLPLPDWLGSLDNSEIYLLLSHGITPPSTDLLDEHGLYPWLSFDFNPESWIALFTQPKAFIQSSFDQFCANPDAINQLRVAINGHLSLDAVTLPSATLTLSPLCSVSFTHDGIYRFCYSLPNTALAGQISLTACVTIDLLNKEIRGSLHIAPTAFDAGVKIEAICSLNATFEVEYNHTISATFGGQLPESLPYSYDDLQLYPLADISSQLGAMLPRFLLNTTLSTLFEKFVLNSNDGLDQLLLNLELGYRRHPTGPIQLRPLDGLILSPQKWLKSNLVLGSPIEGQCVDSGKVVALINHLADAFELADDDNIIQLPYGLLLTCREVSGVEFALTSATPIIISSGDTLALNLNLTLGNQCQVGVGGDLKLRFSLPDPIDGVDLWDTLGIDIGFNNSQFNSTVYVDALQLKLLPFNGWASLISLSDGGLRLLDTALDALLTELQTGIPIDADLSRFIGEIKKLAVTLDLTTPAKIEICLDNPLTWLDTRLSPANIGDLLDGLDLLLSIPLSDQINRDDNLLTFRQGDLTLSVGRDGSNLGAWVLLSGTELGPVTLNFDLGLETTNLSTAPIPSLGLRLACTNPLITLGGKEINPQLSFALNGATSLNIYPLGDIFAGEQFKLNLLPAISFDCNDACISELLGEILLPLTLELLLDADVTTNFLLTSPPGIRLGSILVDCQLLSRVGDEFNFNFPYSTLTAEQFLYRLSWSALKNLLTIDLFDGAIEIVSKTLSNGDTHYGVRVRLPDATLVQDPEFRLLLGNEAPTWLAHTNGPSRDRGGIYIYLPTVDESAPEILSTIDLLPEIELINFGVELTGKNDRPLLDSNGFRLDGAKALLYFSIAFDDGVDIKLGASTTVMQIGLPIGGAGGNVIGQNLLSSDAGSGGENSTVNPTFSIELSYFEELDVRLMGREAGETEIWFPIQKTFGPIHIGQIGIKWHDSHTINPSDGPPIVTQALEILLDGGVSLAGLSVMVDDLGVTIPIYKAGDLSTWSLGLKGLGVSYVGGGVKISGALLRDNDEGTSYSGAVLVEVSGKTFTAIGSYAQDEFTSMFVFVLLPITIGGPPYFFITGLAGGFGYNRGLNVPPVEDTPTFPLIEAANGSDKFSNSPLTALRELGSAVPIKRGSYWIAGGIKFSSFELAKSAALAYILLDRGVEVGILGITQMELPEGNPLVNLELALKARFSTRDGVLSVEARLSDNSWLLSRDCRLTGGFAFYVWFDGGHQGDFVITVGGYHHLFDKPSHYPDVPRLGFNWRVSSKITIKGESYFALTPSAVMAGGLLEASYKSGNLKAWFKAWAHFLIAWKPFAYAIGFGISIGVSYRLRINLLFGSITKTFKVELGAAVEVWGPEFSGIATIDWWVISFDVRFGANVGKPKKDAISWQQFRLEFLPADAKDIIGADVVTGMIVQEKAEGDTDKVTPWILQPEFTFSTSTVIATNRINLFNIRRKYRYHVDIRPMHRTDLISTHHLRLLKNSSGASVITAEIPTDDGSLRFRTNNSGYIDVTLKSEKAPAALWDFNNKETQPRADKIDTFTGTLIVAEVNEDLSKTGEIPVKDIIERGIHPLPFFSELSERSGLLGFSQVAELALPNPHDARAIFVAASRLLGPDWAERRDNLLEQLESMGVNTIQQGELRNTPESLSRLHISPPKIASLYEGMAQEPAPEPDIIILQPPEKPPVREWPLRPSLIAILKQRAEPLQAIKKGRPTRVTEVASGQNLPRVKVTRQLAKKVLGARLLRAAAKTAGKRTLPISQRSEFVRSGHSSKGVRDQFQALEAASLANQPKESRATRNTIAAGATQIWDLPSRNTVGAMPTLSFSGNQGVRVTTLNRGGTLLMEQEFGPGEHLWQPPKRTARIAISGLGKPSTPQTKEQQAVAMGAFALSESTNGFAAVGWQQDSQLVQLSKLTLLARGAVVKLNAPLELTRKGRVVRQAIVEATSISHSNETLETLLPTNVDIVCIQVQPPKIGQQSGSTADIEKAFAISSDTLILADKPLTITSPLHSLLVYRVEGMDYGSHKLAKAFASIGTTTSEGWQVTGVFALKGELEPWMRRLTENSLTPIIENGPLSPAGQTTLQFTLDKGEQA